MQENKFTYPGTITAFLLEDAHIGRVLRVSGNKPGSSSSAASGHSENRTDDGNDTRHCALTCLARLIAERIRWWTSHDQDELVVKMNFLFSCLASCNVLVFMLWIILHCVTRVTMGDHGGWIRAQCRACQENIYWLQAGAGHRAGCKSFLRFMASDTDSHETESVNIFQQWMDTSHSQLLQLHPWHSEVEIF